MDSESLLSGRVSISTKTRVRGSMAMRKRKMSRKAVRMTEASAQNEEELSSSMTQLMKGVAVQDW